MSGAGTLLARALSGSRDTGASRVGIITGFRDVGKGPLLKADIGAIRTTTTKERAGGCMKATGTMRTTVTMTITAMTATTIDVRS